jgi:hypothetical protein
MNLPWYANQLLASTTPAAIYLGRSAQRKRSTNFSTIAKGFAMENGAALGANTIVKLP